MADGAEHEDRDDRGDGALELTFKALRADSREVDFIASTDCVDRYDEVVDQSTWILDYYKSNPVVLFCHQRGELPIGQSTRVEVINGKLDVTIKFASEKANPKAENVFQSVKEGSLRAVSVGFRSKSVRIERRDDRDIYVLSNNELREISVAPIGVNPEALAKMKAKALADANAKNKNVAASRGQEKAMTDAEKKAHEEMLAAKEAEARSANADLINAKKSLESVNSEKAMLETQNKALVVERDAAVKRADEAEKAMAEHDVNALVGKKITAAEKEGFLKLRVSNKGLFDEMIGQRGDLKLDGRVIADEKLEQRAISGGEEVDLFDDAPAK